MPLLTLPPLKLRPYGGIEMNLLLLLLLCCNALLFLTVCIWYTADSSTMKIMTHYWLQNWFHCLSCISQSGDDSVYVGL